MLTRFSAMTLIFVIGLGLVLARILGGQISDMAITHARLAAQLAALEARTKLPPAAAQTGLSMSQVAVLDRAMRDPQVTSMAGMASMHMGGMAPAPPPASHPAAPAAPMAPAPPPRSHPAAPAATMTPGTSMPARKPQATMTGMRPGAPSNVMGAGRASHRMPMPAAGRSMAMSAMPSAAMGRPAPSVSAAKTGSPEVRIWRSDERILYATRHDLIGRRFPRSPGLSEAWQGQVVSSRGDQGDHDDDLNGGKSNLLQIYVPLMAEGSNRPYAVFEMHLPYGPVASDIAASSRQLYLVLGGGLVVLYLLLFPIVFQASKRLRRQALRDDLTDLPNRRLFYQRVTHAIRCAKRDRGGVGVMLIDLDRFKEINDTLGHHNGDLLLREIGPRLQKLPQIEALARLGGDEFALLIPDLHDEQGAVQVAETIRAALEAPFTLSGLTIHTQASVGIALFPEHGDDVDALLQRADVAMYAAKEARAGQRIYTSDSDVYSPERLELVGDLRSAIAQRELTLHYQPKAELRTGRVVGVEALLRWQHPKRGFIPPDQFIPVAEQTGLMKPLTEYVLEAAVAQIRDWSEHGIEMSVAVNLSATNLLEPGLPANIARLLNEAGVAPRLLQLEITESTLMGDPIRTSEVLAELHAMGLHLSIDDFGTGYSSLARLSSLPIDEIKIDRSFVSRMAEDATDAVIVRSTIELGRNLQMSVVAEGVEDEQGWNTLANLGCQQAQGYFLARPMPASELGSWLMEHADPRWEKAAGRLGDTHHSR